MSPVGNIHISPDADRETLCKEVNRHLAVYHEDPVQFDRMTVALIIYHVESCPKCKEALFEIGQSHVKN